MSKSAKDSASGILALRCGLGETSWGSDAESDEVDCARATVYLYAEATLRTGSDVLLSIVEVAVESRRG